MNGNLDVFPSSKAQLSKLSSHASGVRLHDWYGKPRGVASLNPGLIAYQPSGLDSHAGGVLGI